MSWTRVEHNIHHHPGMLSVQHATTVEDRTNMCLPLIYWYMEQKRQAPTSPILPYYITTSRTNAECCTVPESNEFVASHKDKRGRAVAQEGLECGASRNTQYARKRQASLRSSDSVSSIGQRRRSIVNQTPGKMRLVDHPDILEKSAMGVM